jgi:hypothetical protein
MFLEIAQIKRFLAKKHNLTLENADNDHLVKVIGLVPDGEHMIPLGRSLTPTLVRIKDDKISIL